MFRFRFTKTLQPSHCLRAPSTSNCWQFSALQMRPFRTRTGREAIGLGSSKRNESSYDDRIGNFFQDSKMQRLWNNTFERISSLQNTSQQPRSSGSVSGASSQNYRNYPRDSHQDSFTSEQGSTSSASTSEMGSGSDPYGTRTASRGATKSSMFGFDNQQLMKLSFAEGYFYGQESKKRRFTLFSAIRDIAIIGLTVGLIFSFASGNLSIKRVVMGHYEIQPEDIDARFSDVKGCDEAKEELEDVVEFLKKPNKFLRLGGKLPKGVLLIGPPGTGKTLLARAVAGEAGVPFFHAAGSEFDEILVGQGARRVRDLFAKAKQRAPCVIFIDEIDSIGSKRSSSMLQPFANQTVNQLLSEMDGFNQNEGVIVIGATNRSSDLDRALTRPGRFDVQVNVSVPDYKGRKELFEFYLSRVLAAKGIDIDMLCRTTIGFTGADIMNLVNQAALLSATANMDLITQDVLEFARDKILMGPERRSRLPDKDQNLMTAYHEGGHALVAYYTEKANDLHKVTIISRGNSLGHTSTMPERDIFSHTKEQLSAHMDVMLGGRVAEELIYGSERVTSGCEDDLKKANALATKMVKDFGMSEKIGMLVVRDEDSQSQVVINNFSDATSELVESEIGQLLSDSKERVRKLLTEHKKELVLLAEALLKYETLDAAEVKLVIEGKDPRVLRQQREKERQSKLSGLTVSNPKDRLPLNLLK